MNKHIISMVKNIIITKNICLTGNETVFLSFIEKTNFTKFNYTIEEMAKISYVSKATITRFSKKLGFSGFSELKYKINEINQDDVNSNNNYININNSFVYSNYLKTISNTHILTTNIKELIKKFNSFHSIYIIGIGSSNLVAIEFAYLLNNCNITNVEALTDTYNQNLKAGINNDKNLLICLSLSGKNHDIIDIASKFKKNKATILSISSNEIAPLKNFSDYFITAPSFTNKTSKILPLLIVIDMIACYLKNNKI
ncbi:MurR/RpiR family transcriptional regulator [Caviibacter abscessus]|uniref:MurR/RpiR family transcriptional regulator n=1 Tax=Caviibacter abscessus TaxID=1766719 RepID=UPI00082B58CC|nr:MurR/RpiR family transcriptional regulator [Caviibacter abscessus]